MVFVDWRVFVLISLLLVSVPAVWVCAAFLSALVHELCHIAAMKLVGRRILSVHVGVHGTEIRTDTLSGWREIFCLAAGPAGSFCLMLLFRWLPLTAITGLIQGCFNLLPLSSLDGGRILNSLFAMLWGSKCAGKITKVVDRVTVLALLVLGNCCLRGLENGLFAYVWIFLLAARCISRKIPCKLSQLGVQ